MHLPLPPPVLPLSPPVTLHRPRLRGNDPGPAPNTPLRDRVTPRPLRSATGLAAALLCASLPCLASHHPHEIHEPHRLPTPTANDVQAIAVGPDQSIWIATADGAFRLRPGASSWTRITPTVPAPAGPGQDRAPLRDEGPQVPSSPFPCFDIAPDRDPNRIWVATWTGALHGTDGNLTPLALPAAPIARIGLSSDGTALLGGPDGYYLCPPQAPPRRVTIAASRQVNALALGPDGAWWIATGMGVYRWHAREDGPGHDVRGAFDRHSVAVRDLAFDARGDLWAASLGGLQQFRGNRLIRTVNPADGLPSADVRCVRTDNSGRLWAGTERGVARREGGRWVVRQGRRWLLSDDVRDLDLAADGTAWIATGAGVSALRVRTLSLADKAAHFHGVLEARHVRPPGIVEKCRLRTPGDPATWAPTDDDNDGGYTALALAMESYRFAATRDPAALAAARRAFAACEFLQHVTGTPGFLARTVVPSDWTEVHDPNLTETAEALASERVREPRAKYVPVRWRASADGRWLWKGDTSSDEMTAHFFGYYAFHELAAEPEDRQRVRTQVTRLTDHLIGNGFVLRDLDGRPTRWGIWAPERLNDDPDWAMERGINSVEILSFLKVAHHVSGDPRYDHAYRTLLRDHHYDRNVLEAPNLNPAWRTYIDFELLAFAYPALLQLESDPRLARLYRRSFERWHDTVRADGNPFFEFLYAAHASPRKASLDAAREFLIDTPLDLIRWGVDLSQREDVLLARRPAVENLQIQRRLPPSEIGYSRTDQNPWNARQGDGGETESDGVFWLLPYWMGRHHGFVR